MYPSDFTHKPEQRFSSQSLPADLGSNIKTPLPCPTRLRKKIALLK